MPVLELVSLISVLSGLLAFHTTVHFPVAELYSMMSLVLAPLPCRMPQGQSTVLALSPISLMMIYLVPSAGDVPGLNVKGFIILSTVPLVLLGRRAVTNSVLRKAVVVSVSRVYNKMLSSKGLTLTVPTSS